MSTLPWKRAIIVGASSGIGAAITRQLASHGCIVALVSRSADALQALSREVESASVGTAPPPRIYVHDVCDTDVTDDLVSRIVQDMGGLDLLVYAAGIMPHIQPDEYDTIKDERVIAVNFSGAVAWCNPAAARFEKMRAGTIIGISSVAGDRGRRGNPVYGATKAALNAYLESLRNRIERRGAFVVTVKPGPVDTPMTQGLKVPGMISAEQAAFEILAAARDRARIAYIPGKWRYIMAIIRAIPPSLFKWLNI